jgi:hypothetical protein
MQTWRETRDLELGQQQPTLTTILKLAKPLGVAAKEIVGLVENELAAAHRKRA